MMICHLSFANLKNKSKQTLLTNITKIKCKIKNQTIKKRSLKTSLFAFTDIIFLQIFQTVQPQNTSVKQAHKVSLLMS